MWDVIRTGGVRVLFELANRLEERGHNVVVTTLGKPGSHKWFPLKVSDVVYAEQKYSGMNKKSASSIFHDTMNLLPDGLLQTQPFGLLRDNLRSQAIRLLANATPKDIDVNVATFCFSAFSVHKSGLGIPFYYLQHYEPIFFDSPYTKHWVDKTYTLPLNRVTNSSWLKALLKEKFGVDSYGPIIPGIDHDVFNPKSVKKDSEQKVVMALGKSLNWKGLWELFEALKYAQKAIPNLKLVLYGSEPQLRDSCPIPCEYYTKISDTQLAELYSTADMLVTPSWYESSPLPPLEAMACGTPVVTTRYGTEDYCFDRKNCLVVAPKNPQALSAAIIELLKDESLRERFKREGPKTARKFTWENATDSIERLFSGFI